MSLSNLHLTVSDKEIVSLCNDGKELLNAPSPLFRMRLRDRSGTAYDLSSCDALSVSKESGTIVFKGFSLQIQVVLHIDYGVDSVSVRAEISNHTECAVEWIKLLPLCIKPLCGDGGDKGTYLLVPYNEGAIVDSVKKLMPFLPEYPSYGNYMMFPNMVFSQFAAYLYETDKEKKYLLISALDKDRGQKEITVRDGELFIKLYCGGDYGDDVSVPYIISLRSGTGDWQEAVKPYIEWLEKNLPPDIKKSENDSCCPNGTVTTYSSYLIR